MKSWSSSKSMGSPPMHEPHVKHLGGKLWEMRMKGKDGIARAIYVTATGGDGEGNTNGLLG